MWAAYNTDRKQFFVSASASYSCMFFDFVRETFRVRMKISKNAVDAFDQTLYSFRHHGMVRPALRTKRPGF